MCASVLTVQVEPHIYRDTESVSQRVREGQSLLVSVSDCVRMRNNEMLYDFMERTLNKAKRVDSLSYIPHTNSILPTA